MSINDTLFDILHSKSPQVQTTLELAAHAAEAKMGAIDGDKLFEKPTAISEMY